MESIGCTLDVVTEGDPKSVCSTQEVMRYLLNLPAVADRDGAVVAVGIIVDWLLIALETLHKRKEIYQRPNKGCAAS